MRNLSIAIVAMMLSACAANGLPYPEHPASSLVVTGVAKVTIFRADDTLLYSARSARLAVDGERAGRLATGGFRTFKVEPGPHTFTVRMWDAPGTCELTADIQPDVEYFYEVAPRPPTFAASTPGALLLGASPAGVLFGTGVSAAGQSAESSGRQCDGAFSIVPVEPAQALPKVSALRASS
jgi:hypothetical protein